MCLIDLTFWFIKNFTPEKFINDSDINKDGFELIFNDEFESSILDRIKWRPYMYWSGNLYPSTRQYWFDEDNISFEDSSVKLRYRINPKEFKENDETFTIENSIGLICTEQPYNLSDGTYYLEARIKVPNIDNTWVAFWSYGMEDNVNGEPSEIDILEQLSNSRSSFSTNFHITNNFKRHQNIKDIDLEPMDLSSEYHRYGVLKESNKLTFYFDGIACTKIIRDVKYLTDRQHIIINNAPAFTKTENYMYIDWVRLYKKI